MSTAKKKLTTCAPKTAVAYARYSSAGQRDVSIEQQLNDIRAFAEREGYTIIHEYADHAKSGFKNIERRQQFHAMLSASESGAFDTVIAWKVDRFGRNRRESAIYKGQLSDAGVSVVYAMEQIPDGAVGCLTEGMLESLAEWYSRNISENTKRGQHDNAIKCLTNGHDALGYDKGPDNHFIINEAEAAVVKRIYNLYSQGYSFGSISKMLNDEGITTKRGYPFQRSSLLSVIRNESYIGVYHYAGVRIPGGMPPIVDRDLWETCQLQRQKTTRHVEKSPEGYLLSGKCICGFCGAKIHGNYSSSGHGPKGNKRRYYYYVCVEKKRGHCKSARFIHKEVIEKPILDLLFNQVFQGDNFYRFVHMISDAMNFQKETSPVEQLKKEYADVTRKIDNITRAISEGIWSKQTAAMLEELNTRADDLNAKITYQQITDHSSISSDRILFLLQKYAKGDLKDPDYLRTMINALINSVTIYDNWVRVVVNLKENLSRIPPDELPQLNDLQDASGFAFCTVSGPKVYIVEPYPAVAFKIAI